MLARPPRSSLSRSSKVRRRAKDMLRAREQLGAKLGRVKRAREVGVDSDVERLRVLAKRARLIPILQDASLARCKATMRASPIERSTNSAWEITMKSASALIRFEASERRGTLRRRATVAM